MRALLLVSVVAGLEAEGQLLSYLQEGDKGG